MAAIAEKRRQSRLIMDDSFNISNGSRGEADDNLSVSLQWLNFETKHAPDGNKLKKK